MMQRGPLRALFGACLLGVAGISLISGVLPVIISRLFGINSFEIMLYVRGFVIPMALVWAVSGGIVGWRGGALFGGKVMGACGLITGLVVGMFAVGGDGLLILISTLSGLVYGTVGGLIVGKAFSVTVEESEQ